MTRLIHSIWMLLAIVGTAMLTPALLAQQNTKISFKITSVAELTTDTFNRKREDTSNVILENLGRLGKTGWEVIGEGELGIVCRRSSPARTWEYRAVRAPESRLNGKSNDDEVLTLVLDNLATQGWELCLMRVPDGKTLFFKRVQMRYDEAKSKLLLTPPRMEAVGIYAPSEYSPAPISARSK